MKNYVQRGEILGFTATADISAGQGVSIGDLFGVAAHDAANGEAVEISLVGVFNLPVSGTVTSGAAAYWNGSAATASDGAGANLRIGHFLDDQTDGTGPVRLSP